MPYVPTDPRWEDMNLLIPNRKPVVPVTIDRDHPLAKGLIYCWLIGPEGCIDIGPNRDDGVEQNNGPTGGVFASEKCADWGASQNYALSGSNLPTGAANRTVLGRFRSTAGGNHALFSYGSTSSLGNFTISIEASIIALRVVGARNWSGSYNDSEWHNLALRVTGSGALTGCELIVDGDVLSGSGGSGTLNTAAGNVAIGHREAFGDFFWDDQISMVAVWDRDIGETASIKVTRSPFQFLIPK